MNSVSDAWCALGLGSNLGDRRGKLAAALEALREIPGLTAINRAPLYETAPLGCPPGSPPFLNTVVEGRYSGDPFDLLRLTQGIEARLGRQRSGIVNEPRPVDIDLLLIEGVKLEAPELTLPHPRMLEREFVLRPLADLQPHLSLGPRARPIQEWLQGLSASARRVPPEEP